MSFTPTRVETFGGLNLTDDPREVGWAGAIDAHNVDFDRRGRVRTRDGYAKFNAVPGTNYFAFLIAWDAKKQLLAGDSGANNTRAYNNSGTLLASDASFALRTGASLGTSAAGPYFYFSDGTSAARRWDGAAFAAPGGMPSAKCLAVQPTDNRLVAAVTDGATNKSRVKFSNAGAPETWGANDFIDLHPNDGQEIRAMVVWRGDLYVFKETKFFVFYGNSTDGVGSSVFNYRTVDTGIGALSDYVAVAAEDGVYFVHHSGIYRTTGGAPESLPGLDSLFAAGSPYFHAGGTFLAAKQPVVAGHRILFPISITPNQYIDSDPLNLVWNTVERKWTSWQMGNFNLTTTWAALRLNQLGESTPSFLFSYPNTAATKSIGKIVSTATDDDGAALSCRYRSGFAQLSGPRADDKRSLRSWRIKGSGTAKFGVAADGATAIPTSAGGAKTVVALAGPYPNYRIAQRGVGFSWQIEDSPTTRPWVPTDIAGCELWLAADNITGLNDGDPVGTWTDASGQGHDATQGTAANKPLYKTNIVNTKPVVRFDGTNDYMTAGTFTADASRTIFIVAKKATGGGGKRLMAFGCLIYTPSGTWLYNRNQALADVTLTGATDTNWNCLTLRVNSASSLDAYVNSGSAINFDPEDVITTATSLTLAADPGGGSNWADADIAEVIFYDSALSDGNRAIVRDFLGAKYNLGFGSLPAAVPTSGPPWRMDAVEVDTT